MNRAGLIASSFALVLAGCPEKKAEPVDAGAAAIQPVERPVLAPVDAGSIAAPAPVDAGAAGTAAKDAGAAQGTTPGSAGGPAKAEAEQIFTTRCTVCHGPVGKGDGPGSAGLSPKPRDFTDAKWQAEVTDEHIEKIILYGGLAVGRSAAMPPNTDLSGKPEVISALRAHVRSLKGK